MNFSIGNMAYESHAPHDFDVQRPFEVYEIYWSVRDLILLTCDVGWSIQSPEFAVSGLHFTKWKISLGPAFNELRRDFVVLTLQRCMDDYGPDSIRVQWKMTIHVSSQKSQGITWEGFEDFTVGSRYEENLVTLKRMIEAIQSLDSDHLTIRCKMIVYDKNKKQVFEPSADRAKAKLSEDLSKLFQGGANCDLRLKIGEKSISAHKAVACTRIPVLNHLLLEESEVLVEGEREVNVVDMPYLNHEATTKILEYAYSGDLAHVLEEPSLAMFEDVHSLDMHHLKKFYSAKELYFRTLLNTKETRFTWTIEDFLENDGSRMSPVFYDELSGGWRLHIYRTNNDPSDCFSIRADYFKFNQNLMNVCVEFSIVDEHWQSVFSKMLRRAASNRTPLLVDRFIRRSTLVTLLVGTALSLTVTIKMSKDLRPISLVERHDISAVTNSHKTDSFDLLSREMQDSLEMSYFADVWLHCKKDVLDVHRCIVSARCGFLSNLIIDRKDRNWTVIVKDIEKDVLCLLLRYIYGGVVPKDEDRAKVPELRKAAEKFQLPLLEELCEEMLTKVDKQ